jgi:hypothetical protein
MLRTDHGRTSRVPGSATRLRSLFGYRWYRVNHREESVHPGLGVVLSAPRRAPGGVDLTRRSDQARLLFSLLFTMSSQTKLGRRDPLAGHAVMHRAAFVAIAAGVSMHSWLAFFVVIAVTVGIAAAASRFDTSANPRYSVFSATLVEIEIPGHGRFVVFPPYYLLPPSRA